MLTNQVKNNAESFTDFINCWTEIILSEKSPFILFSFKWYFQLSIKGRIPPVSLHYKNIFSLGCVIRKKICRLILEKVKYEQKHR